MSRPFAELEAEAIRRANDEDRPIYVVEEHGRLITTRHLNPHELPLFTAKPRPR